METKTIELRLAVAVPKDTPSEQIREVIRQASSVAVSQFLNDNTGDLGHDVQVKAQLI